MGRQPSDLNEERTMLKAGLFLAFVVFAAVQASGDQKPSNAAMQRYMAYGRPNSMIFLHPTRSMEKRGRQIFLPRPNSLLNALKGKRFLHSSPNSFNFPIWSRPVMEMNEVTDETSDELESGVDAGIASLYDSIEKYGKRGDGNFDVFLGNRG